MQEKNGIGPERSTGTNTQGQRGRVCRFQVASEDPHSSPAFLEILRICPVVCDGRLNMFLMTLAWKVYLKMIVLGVKQ